VASKAPKRSSSRPPARLREYARKRDFEKTSEPPPRPAPAAPVPGAAGAPTFMIHKHHARRLHYDVRLEMDGALASWAVPKGPSYDPKVKRLAIQTEDHPLEYGQFEGRIPDDEYGGGDSLIWDRGSYDTVPPGQASQQRKNGHLHLQLDGEKLRGGWHLVRTRPQGGKAQWLMFKAKDGTEDPARDVVVERPESVVSGRQLTRGPESKRELRAVHPAPEALLAAAMPPMLATLVDAPPPEEAEWSFELKYDGFRVLAARSGGRTALWSRNQLDLGARFPAIARAVDELVVAEAVFDGEICALDDQGVPRFQLLQQGGGAGLVLYAFDLLWLDGEDLRGRPLEQRRELLTSLLSNAAEAIRLAEVVTPPAGRALADAAARGYEGIIAKRKGAPYQPGRSKLWLKIKAHMAQEVVIVGYLPHRALPRAIGSLLLAVRDKGALISAGKVGTGFSQKQRRELYALLARDPVERPAATGLARAGGAVFVAPKHVAQVAFSEWTGDGKLRHPSFLGLRPDKSPAEVVRERPVPADAVAAAASPSARVEIALTNPDKLLYPDDGITKRIVRHLVADRPEVLRWFAQHAVLTVHTWQARRSDLAHPDWVVFDLDPAEGRGIEQTIAPARALERLFAELELPTVVKTSGKRGLHVLLPVAPVHTHKEAAEFAAAVGRAIAAQLPEVTTERSRAARKGRLYLDCMQNGYGKLIVAPYSLRGVPGAPVSTPLRWDEVVPGLDPRRHNLRTVPERLAKLGDLFAPALGGTARLPKLR
jgi:bifunctional non-homologous end joining protein LigD